MSEQFQKAIEDLTQAEAQLELREAWESWRERDARIDELEAENARLQADKTHLFESIGKTLDALAEALGAAAFSPEHTDSPAKYVTILAEERDRYKALAERRGEALPFIEAKLIEWSEDAEEYGSFAWQYRDRVNDVLDILAELTNR